jgi:uncharacterized protein YjbJ (UPF0337 family)
MNAIVERGNLHKITGALKKKFASLTENDQLFKEGEKQEIFGKHKIKLGNTADELTIIIALL